ncbi:cupin domain-containing protein [Spirosoma endbachense]|uniref:Cupin domain-containing protein n=1 Tax=Spirosoma endbachense TaxID=2666025 RepID=A0A6P1VUQ8_9BACT|nr:cupin domain-containing protein [Spirosoma endbachense]QHV96813.1 cupin domain-containing protein [Spirosoma endbachense]
MKPLLSLFFLFSSTTLPVLAQSVDSGVYVWAKSPVSRKATSEQRTLLEGTTTDFKHMKIHATTLPAHQAPHPAHKHDDEELIIIKEGKLTITIEGKTKTLGAGSIALMMPGDEHGFENKGDSPVTYFVMRYESKEPKDLERGKKAGGSFWVDWDEVEFKQHDKGGIRRMFDRATAMTKRFEMHVTTLNQGLWSHPPHTHRAAEILLMTDNTAQESIDGKLFSATKGDLIFLESNVPHAIQNTSQGSCTYFAFQFE